MNRLARLIGATMALVVIAVFAAFKLFCGAIVCIIAFELSRPLGNVLAIGWWLWVAGSALMFLFQVVTVYFHAWVGEQGQP